MVATQRHRASLLITLDRPSKRNALSPEMIEAIASALAETEKDPEIRAVVITGAGPSFCAGLDLDHLAELDAEGRVEYMRQAFRLFRQIYELRQPVISAVNGAAMAGGFDLATFCDLRICTPNAAFAQTEILLGLTQIMHPLYTMIGLGRARELALTGRVVRAEEAYRIGLVNRIVPADSLIEEALATAESIAQRPPEALFATKKLSRELVELNSGERIDRMFEVIASRLRSEEHGHALKAYRDTLRKRRPEA